MAFKFKSDRFKFRGLDIGITLAVEAVHVTEFPMTLSQTVNGALAGVGTGIVCSEWKMWNTDCIYSMFH